MWHVFTTGSKESSSQMARTSIQVETELRCNSEEPLLAEDDSDEDNEQMIEWVACDSCAGWHHIAHVQIESISKCTCTSCK